MNNKESINYTWDFQKIIYLFSIILLTYLAFAGSTNKRKRNLDIKRSQKFRCGGCGKELKASQLEIHHKKPKSQNGKDGKNNLIALGTVIEKGGCGCHKKWDDEALKQTTVKN